MAFSEFNTSSSTQSHCSPNLTSQFKVGREPHIGHWPTSRGEHIELIGKDYQQEYIQRIFGGSELGNFWTTPAGGAPLRTCTQELESKSDESSLWTAHRPTMERAGEKILSVEYCLYMGLTPLLP